MRHVANYGPISPLQLRGQVKGRKDALPTSVRLNSLQTDLPIDFRGFAMTPERWKEVEDLFGRGLDGNAEEREGLLRSVDSELASAVLQLWRQHEDAGPFLRKPAVSLEPVRSFQAGQNLGGRFTILEFIGSGGMGEVYKVKDERL